MARLFQRATVHDAKARIRFLAATTHCSVRAMTQLKRWAESRSITVLDFKPFRLN